MSSESQFRSIVTSFVFFFRVGNFRRDMISTSRAINIGSVVSSGARLILIISASVN